MSGRPSVFAVVVASVLGGVVGAVLMQTFSPAASPAAQGGAAPAQVAAGDVAKDRRLEARLDAMGKQLRELQAREQKAQSAQGNEPSEDRSDRAEDAPPPTPEELRRVAAGDLAERARKFDQEPIDGAWARSAGSDFDQDLSALAGKSGGKFEVVDVACRSRTCRSTLSFANRDDAIELGHGMLHEAFKQNCARSIFTIEPEPNASPSSEFMATLYFDCKQ